MANKRINLELDDQAQSTLEGLQKATSSGFGIVARWGKRWIYFGNVECLQCGDQRVDAVLCRNCGAGKLAT